jgi:hypothetical protein
MQLRKCLRSCIGRNRKPFRTTSFVLVLLSRQRAAVDRSQCLRARTPSIFAFQTSKQFPTLTDTVNLADHFDLNEYDAAYAASRWRRSPQE